MEQFIGVAVAHFLALLIPGVDFFLIARTAMTRGWRVASGACVGIAAANGALIAAAFSGVSLISHPAVLTALQVGGGLFLLYVGVAFLRADVGLDVDGGPRGAATTWRQSLGLGLASGLLNPKNALFYLSLATVLAGAPPLVLLGYGAWMAGLVLVWDVFVAVALGSRRALRRLERVIPWLTRAAGGFLVLFGAAMLLTLLVGALR